MKNETEFLNLNIAFLLSKQLPLMKLHYGGTRPGTSLNIHLQPMRCFGKTKFYPSELAAAERNLLKSNALKIRDELNKKIDYIAVNQLI